MWNDILTYFETLEKHPVQRMIILAGGLLLFWIIEGAIPLLHLQYKKNKYRHAGINLMFTAIHIIIHSALAILIVLLSDWCLRNNFGMVYWFDATALITSAPLSVSVARWYPVAGVAVTYPSGEEIDLPAAIAATQRTAAALTRRLGGRRQ